MKPSCRGVKVQEQREQTLVNQNQGRQGREVVQERREVFFNQSVLAFFSHSSFVQSLFTGNYKECLKVISVLVQ